MQNIVLSFLLLPLWAQQTTSQDLQLKVVVEPLGVLKGTLIISVVDSADAFENNRFVRIKKLQVTQQSQIVQFDSLPPGTYALKIFHDVNNNERLDTSFFGLPKEPYGFSNNAMGTFGPPSFKQCAFNIPESTKLKIRLR